MSSTLALHRADASPILRTMQVAEHVLFAALLVIGAVRGASASSRPTAVIGGAVALGLWYAAGLLLANRRATLPAGLVWLAVLVAGWLLLVAVSVEFSWVAFALFFLAMHLLPVRFGIPVVAVLTVAVIAAQLGSGEGNPVAQVIGPCMGAIVAVGMSIVYARLRTESEQRRVLVEQLVAAQDDLVATHDALAATQREAGALAERARLARDIHDTLAQGFSSIVLLSRAGLALTGDDPAHTHELLEQIESTAVDNLEEARRVVHALAPAALEEAPLAAALGRLVDRLAQQSGIEGQLGIDGEPAPVPTGAEVALLRLAQGALANVRQHSGASRVGLTLTYQSDAVSLDVVDDGRGFEPDRLETAPLGGTGFGLRAMRERLAELGGMLAVETAPGEGTAVSARIPFREAP
jgi:signal transduction histidine kinase